MIMRTSLLPHQVPAVEKLLPLKIGALYMEMGTGKTRTALELIKRRASMFRVDRVLWLCPCSVKKSLERELSKHTFGWERTIKIAGIESLSGSERLMIDLSVYVSASDRTMLVVDESNLVKNIKAIRTRRIIELAKYCKYRLILNGTPITKNEADLFSQWYILDWRILGYRSFHAFAANHLEYHPDIPGKVVRVLEKDYLVRKIAPYSYQVYRSECFDIPEKGYRLQRYDMTPEQDRHYEEVADSLMFTLDEMQPETIYRMFAALQAVISGRYVLDDGKHFTTEPMFDAPKENPRIQALLEVLDGNEDKTIIFCKYTWEIETLLSLLDDAVGFYGGMSNKERQDNLDKFRNGAKYLVANKVCAGFGLNLQFCHKIIYYSNDWDYGTRAQSEDRVHRFGQDTAVEITDICADNSLDMKIMKCLQRKESLIDAIKNELNRSNDVKETMKTWIRGEEDGKTIS